MTAANLFTYLGLSAAAHTGMPIIIVIIIIIKNRTRSTKKT